ncbi:hypothetical protein [Litchfieldia alkalitelluris]|uniref:hypothetical protein n=1 Tax=Litchfieldia alkalitelluris TaxID=304268 RepID=UPI0009962724|nr:hypothetical protein [Litchfieldia alkalitelluris]
MEIERKKRLVSKAKDILNPEKSMNLKVVPWHFTKITKASNWFGNNNRVQQVISNYYDIKK